MRFRDFNSSEFVAAASVIVFLKLYRIYDRSVKTVKNTISANRWHASQTVLSKDFSTPFVLSDGG
jgi:hypothetical protein